MTLAERTMRNVKLAQAQLCAAALSREVGEIDTDDLVMAAMRYARAAGEWRSLVQHNVEVMADPSNAPTIIDRLVSQ